MTSARVWRLKPAVLLLSALCLAACGNSAPSGADAPKPSSKPTAAAGFPPAPPASTTGGFDGERAYKHVEQLVAIGPHSAGSEGIKRAQAYIVGQLKGFGCPVDEEDFHAGTPVGDVAMKNIVVKLPSSNPNIIMFASHYDTKRIDNFVGADDGGSSTGVLLELARLLCARKNEATLWLTFFDGEEAFRPQWEDPDHTYGSKELAARMALAGQLPQLKAMVLVDMVGPTNPVFRRDANSTPWLTDLVWSTAARLGYGNVFISERNSMEDDHTAFVARGVPAVDIIDFENPVIEYWHTPQDTLDKVDPRALAITGHVLIASVPELEKHVH